MEPFHDLRPKSLISAKKDVEKPSFQEGVEVWTIQKLQAIFKFNLEQKRRNFPGEIQDKLRLEQPHPGKWHAPAKPELLAKMKELLITTQPLNLNEPATIHCVYKSLSYTLHVLLQFTKVTWDSFQFLKVIDTASSVLDQYWSIHQSLTKIPRMHLYASHEAETALKKWHHHSSPRISWISQVISGDDDNSHIFSWITIYFKKKM